MSKKKPKDPIRVKFIKYQKEEIQNLELRKGKIIETPEPEKVEKPVSESILSRHDSKAHDSKSDIKKKKYKSSKKTDAIKKAVSKPTVRKKIVRKKKISKKIKSVIVKKARKKTRLVKTDKTPVALKGLFKFQDNLKKEEKKNKKSIFEGFDTEKLAKLDTGDKEDESDTETVSLDTQEFKYASYFTTIKRQIERAWAYPEQAAIKGLRGELLLQFIIERDGRLVDISLINSSGHKILDLAALDAVKIGSPFNPFPLMIQKKKLRIIASFKYNPFYTSYK